MGWDWNFTLGIATALATVATAAFLAWDRIEKLRLPTPHVEMRQELSHGDTTLGRLIFTIRNRADASVRIWLIEIVLPVGGVLQRMDPQHWYEDHRSNRSRFPLTSDIAPHGSTTFGLDLRARDDAAARSAKLKINVHMSFNMETVSRRRVTITRQLIAPITLAPDETERQTSAKA